MYKLRGLLKIKIANFICKENHYIFKINELLVVVHMNANT